MIYFIHVLQMLIIELSTCLKENKKSVLSIQIHPLPGVWKYTINSTWASVLFLLLVQVTQGPSSKTSLLLSKKPSHFSFIHAHNELVNR